MGRPAKTPNDELDKFLLRMPDGLRERIKRFAERNNRSMNSEIVSALEAAYPTKDFDFASFMVEYVRPVLSSDSLLRERMIRKANDYLLMTGEDMELSEIWTSDGPASAAYVLRIGDTSFRVGDATELIMMEEDYTKTSGDED